MFVRWLDLHNFLWNQELGQEMKTDGHLTTWTDLTSEANFNGGRLPQRTPDFRASTKTARPKPISDRCENGATEANLVITAMEVQFPQVVKAGGRGVVSGGFEGIDPISSRPSRDRAGPLTVEEAIVSSGPLLRPIC
jgi:hypothetical protein